VHARVSNSATCVARFQRGRATSLSCRSAPLRTSPPCTTAAVLGGTANRPARRAKRIGVAGGQETGAYFRDLIFSKSTPVQCEALYVFGEISPSPTTVEIMLFVAGFRITGAMSHWWNAC
jgi:hypothetical protein